MPLIHVNSSCPRMTASLGNSGGILVQCGSLVIFAYGVICILPTLGIAWGAKMKRGYAPYRSLKPYRVMGLGLLEQGQQSSTHDELGNVEYPLKDTVVMCNYLDALLGRGVSSRSKSKT